MKHQFVLLFIVLLLNSCAPVTDETDLNKHYTYIPFPFGGSNLHGCDIELFKKTKAWELAKAVYEQDTSRIKKLCSEDNTLVHVKEPKFQFTLLSWAVYNFRFLSSKALLECGSDPNERYESATPVIDAAREDASEFLTLLLHYGGDVNAFIPGKVPFKTPVEAAASRSLENLKLLVEKGANVNGNDNVGRVLASAGANTRGKESQLQTLEYLITKCGADFRHPLYYIEDTTPVYIREYLVIDTNYSNTPEKNKIRERIIGYIDEHSKDSVRK